jgi:isoquinoline 1-oxidoreductase
MNSVLESRREFLQRLGGGLVVLVAIDEIEAQESGGVRRRGGGAGRQMPQDIGAWIHIGQDGVVNVFTGKAEVGQNTRTSLTQAVADELRMPVASVRLIMADTDLVPYDAGTFGSLSTPQMAPVLRRAAAAARESLIRIASEQWTVPPSSIHLEDGAAVSGAHKSGFGDLTKGQKMVQTIPAGIATTPASQWTVAGKPCAKVNGREFVNGEHKYSTDMTLPGMLHGKVLRPSAFGAKLVSLDAGGAESMSGVKVVRDGNFVGVVAADSRESDRALAALRADWNSDPQPSSRGIYDYLKKNASAEQVVRNQGSMDRALADAQVKLSQQYQVAYIAHTPLEPRAAVAQWQGERLNVWTGTQRPFGVRSELAEAFGIPEDRIRVIVPDTGSGYGGKHTGEAAVEAARLAKAASKPVKLVWTRAEEFTWAYARPAAVIEISSAVDRDGRITGWEFHNYNSGTPGIDTLYTAPNKKIVFHPVNSPLRQGSYRALGSTSNHFARESHIDELAAALKMDPLEFRLKNLADERMKAVLTAAAEKFGWNKTKPAAGRGFGIAGGFEKNGYVATVVEAAREGDAVKVIRAVTAFDCGAVVNPLHLNNQVEGAIVQGLGGALFESVEFDNGRVTNARLSAYRVPRFNDVPVLETVLLDRKDVPSAGAGECPIVALAPSISNALFMATGVRLRAMPLRFTS